MRTRNLLFNFTTLLAAGSLLAGCFGRGGDGSADANSISVWMFPQGDDEVAIHAMESAFEEAHAGKDVVVVVYPEEEYVTKVNTALVAGNPPDVAIIESDDWMKAGYAVELTDKLPEWGVSVDDFNLGGMSRGALENDPAKGIYGVGTFLGGNVLVYNKAIFDAAGVPYPSPDDSMTFQEYAGICRQLAQPSDDPATNVYGCSMPADIAFGFYPIFGDDGRTAEGNMNAPELAEAFEIGASLINDGLAPSSSVLDTIAESDLFAQGQIAMTWSDFTAVPTYDEAEIDFGMTPFFVVEGQEDFVDTWTAPWGTFTESAHPEDALAFLEFIATDAQEIQMAKTPDPPLSTVVADTAGYGDDDPIKQDFLAVLANARPLPFAPPGVEAWDPVEVMRLLTIEGQTDAQAILDGLAASAQEQLDAVWERWDTLDRAQFEEQVEEEQAEASAEPSE
ncbi:MAG: multiple sugar transport system substrate-binding protein [Chloroflexota bacterium]|jgi:multiple sugar transport system substrate-binding protein|nr:multiple sugar transport system substrate-binding protein [Chloroflexota bacterium]